MINNELALGTAFPSRTILRKNIFILLAWQIVESRRVRGEGGRGSQLPSHINQFVSERRGSSIDDDLILLSHPPSTAVQRDL